MDYILRHPLRVTWDELQQTLLPRWYFVKITLLVSGAWSLSAPSFYCLQSTVYYLLSTVYCLLSTINILGHPLCVTWDKLQKTLLPRWYFVMVTLLVSGSTWSLSAPSYYCLQCSLQSSVQFTVYFLQCSLQSTVYCLLFIVYCLLSTVCCFFLQCTVYCLQSTVNCLPSTNCCLPSIIYCLSSIV